MSSTAFLLLDKEPINTIGVNVLQPLLKTQGLDVITGTDISEVPENTRLLFIETAVNDAWGKLKEQLVNLKVSCDIVLFNLDENPELANRALLSGIRGVFYTTDNADVLMKGIRLLMEDQLWYRREIMCNALNRMLQFNKDALHKLTEGDIEPVKLTKREKAIITLMSKGSKNKEIAEDLNISPHTVKTHLYSAFRKTKCRNRIELLSWAQQNIPDEIR
ncbi:DNA-binding response regulator [Pseudoalteromonas rubra]|jgi:DNA-binding NarL/FixJ family response regulator|uniref:DNA-binding response regulator n=1 Tax=Pseudoalteromonas rubra TaxID=43658 RepID=A0A5S3WYL6_9GAMM|nr:MULTISPECIES: response regulator transcription factor [Pseudoalteromonas]AZZ99843.1 response regulator transcription factor [Pseudoalteromonas sp. R3]MCO7190080.1 response regulator transcription factor [Pseudoalteromonas sp. XMcav2-N]TMP26769.1 DNA-binding response regulator [Pseudoalteromonas rubra]TMP30742.1 DNA-binding response regulator [Pseudoalteromonas rubra]TMP34834.1 DNA-binding response regulator [Pseudoalteromonas rubra]